MNEEAIIPVAAGVITWIVWIVAGMKFDPVYSVIEFITRFSDSFAPWIYDLVLSGKDKKGGSDIVMVFVL